MSADRPSIDLAWDCELWELDHAIREVQGRARTNRLDDEAAAGLALEVLGQVARAAEVARVLDCRLGDLQPSATWCPTATPNGGGQHTQVRLYGWMGVSTLTVTRGPIGTTGRLGVVTLHIPTRRSS